MKYQIEQPSIEDLFGNKGHDNTATAMMQTLEYFPDVHLIGLEGELGAGKSTVLKLLENKLSPEQYKFIYFDVEKYHHSSTKSSFIKVISENLLFLYDKKDAVEKIKNAKDIALGNQFTYTKKVDSNLPWITFIFILSMLLSARYLIPAINNFDKLFQSLGNYVVNFTTEDLIILIGGISPLLIALFLKGANLISSHYKDTPNWIRNLPSIGGALKRDSIDTISETLLVNKEVGPIELANAFESFIKVIPKNNVVILIVDNLDRVHSKKVKEVWSDLEIFTSMCNDKLRIIVPYSESHISSALSSDKKEDSDDLKYKSGQEFISKRIPVVFRAPPIMSAGWREPFATFWNETLLENKDGKNTVCDLIDLWAPTLESKQVTPRFLKKHINDIASTIYCNQEVNPHPLCCSTYLLVCKINKISIQDLLSYEKHSNDSINIKIVGTKRILNKVIGENQWPEIITAIHYQTTIKQAKAELLGEPVKIAVKNHNDEEIIELSKYYGFDIEFGKFLNSTQIEAYDLVILLHMILNKEHLQESEINDRILWTKNWLSEINYALKLSKDIVSEDNYDQDLINAYVFLQNNEYDINIERINNETTNLIPKIIASSNNEEMLRLTKYIYGYCTITGNTPSIISKAKTNYFMDILWPNRITFTDWDIGNIDTTKIVIDRNINYISGKKIYLEAIDYIKEVLKTINVGQDIHRTINIDLNEMLNLESNHSYLLLPYCDAWSNDNIQGNITLIVNRISESNNKGYYTSILLMYLIQKEAYNNQYQFIYNGQNQRPLMSVFISNLINEHSFEQNILNDLSLSTTSLKLLMTAYNNEHIKPIIKNTLKYLILNSRIETTTADYIFSDKYNIYKEIVENDKDVLKWQYKWIYHGVKNLDDWELAMVNAVLKTEDTRYIDAIWDKINKKQSMDYWNSIINNNKINTIKFIKYFNTQNKTFKYSQIIVDSIINHLDKINDSTEIDENLHNLISMLPSSSRNRIFNNINNIILNRTIPVINKLTLINSFSKDIELKELHSINVQEQILDILEKLNNQTSASWLTSQINNFDEWNENKLYQLQEILEKHSNTYDLIHLNNLCKKAINNISNKQTDKEPETQE